MYCSVKLSAYIYTEHTPVFLMWLDYSTLLKTKNSFCHVAQVATKYSKTSLACIFSFVNNCINPIFPAALHRAQKPTATEGSTAAMTVTQSLIQSLGQCSGTVCMVSTKGGKKSPPD